MQLLVVVVFLFYLIRYYIIEQKAESKEDVEEV